MGEMNIRQYDSMVILLPENGFYKLENDVLTFGQSVESLDFYLNLDNKDENIYPQYGWYYFDTKSEANEFFQIPENVF
jgi:hypothetical protein